MLNNKAQNEIQHAHINSNQEEIEAHVENWWDNFPSQTNQKAIIMAQVSMTKARAKSVRDWLNACLQARFSGL